MIDRCILESSVLSVDLIYLKNVRTIIWGYRLLNMPLIYDNNSRCFKNPITSLLRNNST